MSTEIATATAAAAAAVTPSATEKSATKPPAVDPNPDDVLKAADDLLKAGHQSLLTTAIKADGTLARSCSKVEGVRVLGFEELPEGDKRQKQKFLILQAKRAGLS